MPASFAELKGRRASAQKDTETGGRVDTKTRWFTEQVDALIAAAQRGEPNEVRRRLREIVPEYRPSQVGRQ